MSAITTVHNGDCQGGNIQGENAGTRAAVIKEHNCHIYLSNSYWFQINIQTYED